MLKTSPQLAGILLATNINNGKFISSSGINKKKLAKSDLTKHVCKAKKLSFLIPNIK